MALASLLDTALDRALIGYGNLGYLARRPLWHDLPPDALAGRVALVTGARTGLGRATTLGLARLGARVHMVVRERGGGETARGELLRELPGAELVVETCDVSSLASVRGFAAGFDGPVHALVHNAGVMPPHREETAEGFERTFATHVLGPHLLTALLRPALDDGARVIWVSSGGMYAQPLRIDDLQYEQGEYKPTAAYARTKRMQVALAREWAEHLDGTGIAVHSAHPGWADTPGIADSLPLFKTLARPILRTPEQGADTFVWLAAADEPGRCTGRFWHDRRPRPEHYLGRHRESAADRRALWDACRRLAELPSEP